MSAPNLLSFDLNDTGNAKRILACHGEDMLFCREERAWYAWDGKRWQRDDFRARRLAQDALAQFQQRAKRSTDAVKKFACRSLDEARIKAALSLVRNQVDVSINGFDQLPYLLNFANGTLDLRTGKLCPHDRANLITRTIEHEYNPDASCPTFLAFLKRIMGGNGAMTEYLQRALGYSLTGETSERVVFIAYGPGTNGKTTLLGLIRDLLGPYSAEIMIDSLMSLGPGAGASTTALADLSALCGGRFATTSEGERGQRLSSAVIKRITQGTNGVIKVARKYENPFEFRESHKLWMDTNHLPEVDTSDDALWNRLHPIPFAVKIPRDEIDQELPQKLRAEASGVLAWLVEGTRQWYANGLNEPQAVTLARNEWRATSEFGTEIGMAIAPGVFGPSCTCGECEKCKSRERMRSWRERQKAVA